jgi:hypothetical protein
MNTKNGFLSKMRRTLSLALLAAMLTSLFAVGHSSALNNESAID